MRVLITMLTLAGLSACATTAVGEPSGGDMSLPRCTETVLAPYVGQQASGEVGARMLAATGARALRWVPPGTMVTMDYRFDRLTVRLGADGRIAQAGCN